MTTADRHIRCLVATLTKLELLHHRMVETRNCTPALADDVVAIQSSIRSHLLSSASSLPHVSAAQAEILYAPEAR